MSPRAPLAGPRKRNSPALPCPALPCRMAALQASLLTAQSALSALLQAPARGAALAPAASSKAARSLWCDTCCRATAAAAGLGPLLLASSPSAGSRHAAFLNAHMPL